MKPVSIAFLWHMHQPLYRLRGERVCFMPWVRLHALRSYYDMARVLEEFPDVRVSVNLVPVLLEQLRAYEEGGSDLFWEMAARPAEELDEQERCFLFDHFFSAHTERMIGDLPRFADLLSRRDRARRTRGPAAAWKEFSNSDYRDFQALFDLSWFGFKALEEFPELRALRRRGNPYTQENIRGMHAIEREILKRIRPLYRGAAARGQIEIATSPYAHPILPLLIDTEAARVALPRVTLPPAFRAPEDARAQIEEGLRAAERELGIRPAGVWPPEGAVSQAAAEMLAACEVAWAASDEQVLLRSELEGPADPGRPWRLAAAAAGPALVFRDRDLSDRIGFSYARLDAAGAADDFMAAVAERSRKRGAESGGLLLIALDGENPWESYPNAGGDFLRALYGKLRRSPGVACRTVREAIEAGPRHGTIRRLHAGSWIRGDFGTWIGGPEKNRAWGLLGRVRAELLSDLRDPRVPERARREAWASIRAAEGSDWFWWLDDQFASAYKAQFDRAFRDHLRQAYEALGKSVPEFLSWPVRSPQMKPGEGELAEPASWLDPRIDGFEDNFFEWYGAVRLSWTSLSALSTMQRSSRPVESLRFGFSRSGEFLLRLDPQHPDPARPGRRPAFAGTGLDLSFRVGERTHRLLLDLGESGDLKSASLLPAVPENGRPPFEPLPSRARAVARKILELSVPFQEVGLIPGQRAGLLVRLRSPEEGVSLREIDLRVPMLNPPAKPGGST